MIRETTISYYRELAAKGDVKGAFRMFLSGIDAILEDETDELFAARIGLLRKEMLEIINLAL